MKSAFVLLGLLSVALAAPYEGIKGKKNVSKIPIYEPQVPSTKIDDEQSSAITPTLEVSTKKSEETPTVDLCSQGAYIPGLLPPSDEGYATIDQGDRNPCDQNKNEQPDNSQQPDDKSDIPDESDESINKDEEQDDKVSRGDQDSAQDNLKDEESGINASSTEAQDSYHNIKINEDEKPQEGDESYSNNKDEQGLSTGLLPPFIENTWNPSPVADDSVKDDKAEEGDVKEIPKQIPDEKTFIKGVKGVKGGYNKWRSDS